jgi:uncharacterized protein YbjT (DUF2867 family)
VSRSERPITTGDAGECVSRRKKLLLISAVVPGERLRQHRAAIDAAKQAGVKVFAYTSMLRADSSDLELAAEHKATEDYLKDSGVNFVLLRNGWYLEITPLPFQPHSTMERSSAALARGVLRQHRVPTTQQQPSSC